MKVSAGEGVKSCGIHTLLWTWESHTVRRFRFWHAVDVAIKQVGIFSLCYVFICFCNHSSRSRTERDQFVFGCFYRSRFAFDIIHQCHERKKINMLCLAVFIDPSSGSVKATKHKLISFRLCPWWMNTKANKDVANRKFMATYGSRIICQPCDLLMIVVSTIPDNALLRKLHVLHPTKFWIFPPIDKNSVLSR